MTGDVRNPLRKRRNRVQVSCFSCRTLKTKCDGVKPECSTCAHNGRSCVYIQQGIAGSGGNTVMVDQEYLRTLEKRLELLERSCTPGPSRSVLTTCKQPQQQHNYHHSSHPDKSSSVVADANVSMGGVSFAQLILNALHGPDNVKAQSMESDRDVRTKQSHLTGEDLYTLPVNAKELLDQFFTLRHTLSPLFHVPTVRPLFDTALRCPPEDRHHHRAAFILLNMMFAICTSHWLTDIEANPHRARKHYDIAMALMQPNLLRDWSLEHVQALLLGTRYLQGSNCADECWNVLGLAIRIAYGLRLHHDPPESEPAPLRETKRRVWYAAYTLDMLLSMIYERPPAIRSAECSVELPEDLEDTCIQADGLLYPMPRRPSSMSFSIEVVKLYHILESLVSRLPLDTDNERKIAELVITLDEEYRMWRRTVPTHLILDYNDPKEQPWILALRANMVRILIHRQSLVVTLQGLVRPQQMEDCMVNNSLQYSRNICITAAMETIDIVALRHEQTKKTMGLNWFNIYYLFNAVIVLVSHVVDPKYSNDKPALAKVDMALHMIKAMSNNHSFAQRAYSFLQQVLGYMHQSMGVRQHTDEGVVDTDVLPDEAQQQQSLTTDMQGPADPIPDLYTLFGLTQDLTDNLEMHLGSWDNQALGRGVWPLNESGSASEFMYHQ